MDEAIRILVVDDEENIRDGCTRVLSRAGYEVESCSRGEEALKRIANTTFHIVLLDLKMPGTDGIDVLRQIRATNEEIIVIIITGYATVEAAVEALKLGAYDLMPKPFQTDHLRIVVGRACERLELTRQARLLDQQRRKSLVDLDTEKSRIRTIVESLPDGVIVTNTEGRVVLMNQPFSKMASLDPTRLWGEHISSYVDNEDLVELAHKVSDCSLTQDAIISRELELGSGKFFLAEGRPIIDRDHECLGGVITLIDITPMKLLDRLRSEYVSRVTHELRSPLATIYNQLAQVFGDLGAKAKYRDQYLLTRAMERTEGLISLIGDLLDLSRIEEGSFSREPKEMDVVKLLGDIVDFLRDRSDAKKQQLELTPPGSPLPQITADPVALESIFGNLITNAIKYTPEGGSIRASAEMEDGNIKVQIADTGFGIDERDKEKIFERFYRVRSDATRHIIGTGLGLPIVKALLGDIGGTIEVESSLGKGSTFTVRIPTPSR